MREIKFRAKPRNTLEIVPWVYGDYLTIRLDGHPTGMIHKPYELFDREPDDPYTEVIESTLGQYTGLKDKNGKEIYEGDIYSEPYGPDGASIGTIENINGDTVLRFLPGTRPEDWNQEYYPVFGKLDDGKVVGNIYENPELLEAGKKEK